MIRIMLNRISWEHFLLFAVRSGVFVMLLTPLVFSRLFFFPTLAPQALYFRILVGVTFAFYLLLVFESRKYLPQKSPLLISLALLLGVLALATFFGIHPAKSFWGTFHRLEGLIAFIHYGLFFIILTGVFKKISDWIQLFRGTLFISIPIAIFGLLEYFSFTDFLRAVDYTRADATLGNPSFYGGYLVFIIFIGFLLTFLEKQQKWKLLTWGITILNMIMLLLSGTRSAWMAIIISTFVFMLAWLLFIKERKNVHFFRILLGFAVLLSIFLSFILALNLYLLPDNTFWSRYTALWNEGISGESSRVVLLEIASEAWKERPILGYGPESFIHLYDTRYDTSYEQALFGRNLNLTEFYDKSHNVFSEFLLATGLVGLFTYLSFFGTVAWMLQKSLKNRSALIISLLLSFLIAYLIQNSFIFDITATYMFFMLVLGFIHIYVTKPQLDSTNHHSPSVMARMFLVIGIFILTGVLVAQANQGIFLTHMTLAKGNQHLFSKGEPLIAFEHFSKVCTIDPLPIRIEACAQGIQRLSSDPFQPLYSVETEQRRQEHLRKAALQFESDLKEYPAIDQVLYRITLANAWRNLYLRTQDIEYLSKAEDAIQKGTEINPAFIQLSRLSQNLELLRSRIEE